MLAGRRYELKKKYGITPEIYLEMLDRQGGVCALCKKPGDGKALCVDHDHASGKVRGLLCHSCNVALGLLKDDAEVLRRAIEYLAA